MNSTSMSDPPSNVFQISTMQRTSDGGVVKALGDWPALTPEERTQLGLSRRVPKPATTVAARHEEVLDMWDDENLFGPNDIPTTSPVKVRWICGQGHKFVESAVVQCGAASGWRQQAGGSRACLTCASEQVHGWVRLECGHEVIAKPGAENMAMCRPCRTASFAARKAVTGPKYPIGTVIQSRNLATSQTEQRVRDKLIAAGFTVHKGRSAIQCGHEPQRNNFPILTPDILISKSKVCVEVDPAHTHVGKEKDDRTRNQLLAGAGWQVVRLRIGGLGPIGEHDVVAESESVTNEAMDALASAVSDAVAGLPGIIRRIGKKAPTAVRQKSRLGAIAEHKYYENGFYVSWQLNSGRVERMAAMDHGRYLAIAEGWDAPRFICPLGLDELPRKQWRTALQDILEQMSDTDFVPKSRFPWGDELFIGEQASTVRVHPKFHLGASAWDLTANIVGVDTFTETAICAGAEVQSELHPGAVQRGWQIAAVRHRMGPNGAWQEIQLLRHSPSEAPTELNPTANPA